MTHLKLAVLQTGRAPKPLRAAHGDYDDMCAAFVSHAPYNISRFAVLDGDFPDSPHDYDAFLVTGSPYGAYEDHDWIPPLESLIQKAYDTDKKIIGICFGHQIIAQALGGKVEKSDKGLGTGVMHYELIAPDGKTYSVALHAWHQDQVTQVPEGATLIARSAFCPIAGLQYGERALSFQAHPEFSSGFMADLTNFRRGGTLSNEAADISLASLNRDVDADKIETMIVDFLAPQ